MTPGALDDALLAARLCAFDPVGLGGIILRGGDSQREEVVELLCAAMPAGAPVRRLPNSIDDERLLGGLDLGATLAKGAVVTRSGLLAEADGGVVVVPMAERLSDASAARIAAVIDACEVAVERDGTALRSPARIALILLDDGIEPDECPPGALAERLAFHVDLRRGDIAAAAEPLAVDAASEEEIVEALAATTVALGIDSARAPLFALRTARAAAALAGRAEMSRQDAILAVRLVLAPRATQLAPAEQSSPPEASPPAEQDSGTEDHISAEAMEDILLAAVRASLPKDVLARLSAAATRRGAASLARGAGERRRSTRRGRPAGTRAGLPRGGMRLALIDTLRAAAPWQKLRRSETDRRVRIRRDDLRIRRFQARAEATTIFAVDASGSSALARLAEAKGAVELLLAEAYVKRVQVALIAFRGSTAEILLPPTRSLARARRALADLPGGGGTPLATGLEAARALAESARSRGRTPFVVVLTDGRANVAADGSTSRKTAEEDAETAARAIGAAGIAAAFIDISARPRPAAAQLAATMGARYLALPNADAATMQAAVRAAQPAGRR